MTRSYKCICRAGHVTHPYKSIFSCKLGMSIAPAPNSMFLPTPKNIFCSSVNDSVRLEIYEMLYI